ncbi:hypothetical protein EYC80_001203 [Monilinia laxa]|uniref:Uncharacterized protein n=1 Tax=Monilinia laxa TaxID=61186 RepID=A0A5N6K8F4_MONLA|nr:hypothetical protein EYC80_001203 [Monilinia laxa]
MEKNYDSRKRKHTHEHESRYGESGKHHKHNHHDIAHARHARDHSLERFVDKRQPLGIRDQNELSGDDNYVRNWLAQTQTEDAVGPFGQSSPRIGHPEELGRHSHYTHTTYRPVENRNTVTSKAKPDHGRTFSDSSLIKVSTAPVVKERTKIPERSHATEYGEDIKRSHKHRKNAPSTTTSGSYQSSVVQPKQEPFEKRARHKTREDRYDTQKRISRVEITKKPIKRRREKRGDRKKAARRASEELMNNFASSKIGQDRLTARPPNGPGIFQNGRASSPPRRRGLPDLAFSEMEFLQRSSKKSHLHDSIIVSKTRAKEKKKAAREQDEIATFFKPSKTPIRSNSSIFEHPTSPASIHETSLYERQLRREHDHVHHRCYVENLRNHINNTESHLIDPRGQQALLSQVCFPRVSSPQLPSKVVGNLKTHPETTDSVVTWSESQHSPRATMALDQSREEYFQRQHSATPDSVRRSIERTGIFKDTGIEYSSRRKSYLQEVAGKEVNEVRKEHGISTSNDPVKIGKQLSRLSPDSAKSSYEIDRPPNCQQQCPVPQILPSLQKKTENPPLKDRPPDSIEVEENKHRRVIIEYYDPHRGWYRKEDSKSPTHPLEPVAAPILVPFTRQQITRNARIKRPSTTLPVIREASDESRENSPSSISGVSGEKIQRTESAPIRSSVVEGDISGYISNLHTNVDEAQERLILEPQIPGPISSQIDSRSQHNQQGRPDQQIGSISRISRDAIPQSVMTDEREGQTRSGYLNGMTHTPSKPTLHISPNRENLPFLTQPPFRREPQTSHDPPRQYIASIPRSPRIPLPSLYVQQLEYEQNEMSNGVSNENVEECGALEVQEPHFKTSTCDENWDNAQTEDEKPCEMEDVLGYIGDLGELGPQEANTGMFEGSTSRPEVTGFGYENAGLDFQSHGYPAHDNRRDGYNDWNSGHHFLRRPWIKNQRGDSEQQYEMNYHSNELVQPSFREELKRELDEEQDDNASETILMRRFWRPNPQY